MKRAAANFASLIVASLVGVGIVLLLEESSKSYSSLTIVLAVFTFGSVIAAAMMIAWAAEASQFSISQGLALAIVAIVQTLPEFFVEGAIAWNAGQQPAAWLPNVTANFTGANRLLTGLGWPLILFTALIQRRRNGTTGRQVIALRKEHSIEVVFMLGATLYFIVIWLKGSLELVDTIVLSGAFLAYLWLLSRLPSEEEDPEEVLDASPLAIVKMPKKQRGATILGLFFVSGFVFVVISTPFVDSINTIAEEFFGAGAGFFFIQWIAPFLSEFPEKVTAFHWARKIKLAPMALLNFVSSAVSELTALVAVIPVVFAFSVGGLVPVSSRRGVVDHGSVPLRLRLPHGLRIRHQERRDTIGALAGINHLCPDAILDLDRLFGIGWNRAGHPAWKNNRPLLVPSKPQKRPRERVIELENLPTTHSLGLVISSCENWCLLDSCSEWFSSSR